LQFYIIEFDKKKTLKQRSRRDEERKRNANKASVYIKREGIGVALNPLKA